MSKLVCVLSLWANSGVFAGTPALPLVTCGDEVLGKGKKHGWWEGKSFDGGG